MKMSPLEIEQCELRKASIHEAAHVVVARNFGLRAEASIWRTHTTNPDEKAFVGQATLYGRLPDGAGVLIALAGIVAEQIDDDPGVDAVDVGDWLDWGVVELSATDAALAGTFDQNDLERCLSLVRDLWIPIGALSGDLIAWCEP